MPGLSRNWVWESQGWSKEIIPPIFFVPVCWFLTFIAEKEFSGSIRHEKGLLDGSLGHIQAWSVSTYKWGTLQFRTGNIYVFLERVEKPGKRQPTLSLFPLNSPTVTWDQLPVHSCSWAAKARTTGRMFLQKLLLETFSPRFPSWHPGKPSSPTLCLQGKHCFCAVSLLKSPSRSSPCSLIAVQLPSP